MSLVKVWTEMSSGKCQSLPAKIISKKGSVFTVAYLSPTDERDSKNKRIYKYEDDTYEITDESITEYLDSDSELDFGFQSIGDDKFVKCDYDLFSSSDDDEEDEDYEPSSSSSSDDDEDEDEDEEDFEEDFLDE